MKKTLRNTIFPTYLAVIVLSLAAAGWFTAIKVKSLYISQTERNLLNTARLVKQSIRFDFIEENIPQLDALCRESGALSGVRITFIDVRGRVLGDTGEEPGVMENHADRPEFKQAAANGVGISVRYSPTLKKEMMYLAIRHYQQAELAGVVRTSIPLTSIGEALLQFYSRIILAGIVIAMAAAVAAFWVAKSITSPLEQMKEGAQRFSAGDFSRRLAIPKSEELARLAKTLNTTAVMLQERISTIDSQRRELEAVLSNMSEGVLVFGPEERLLKMNNSAGRMLGIDPAESAGRFLPEIIRNSELRDFMRKVSGQKTSLEREIEINDGELILKVYGAILKAAGEDLIGSLFVLHDVTKIVKMERLRKEFVANVSHEFKTPITTIKGFIETLLDGALDDRENTMEFLGIANRHIDRLNSLVGDLLTLSQIENFSELNAFELKAVKLIIPVQNAVKLCSQDAAEKNLAIEIEGREECRAIADEKMLEQALVNLLTNAINYSEPGKEIIIGIEEGEHQTEIFVKDFGIGIEKEHQSRIFERFYRIEKDRNRKLGGTGLGLAIVKHAALVHGGRVEVDSVIGRGSTFRIFLPK